MRRCLPSLALVGAIWVVGAPPALAAAQPVAMASTVACCVCSCGCGMATSLPPRDLADALRRLAIARVHIEATGEVPLRYTAAELHAQVQQGRIPHTRYMVRLIHGPARPEDPMAFPDATGALPLWLTTFDQLEPADSDPVALTALLGLTYDPSQRYTLLVMQDARATAADHPTLICPTYPALAELAATELATPTLPAETLRASMALAYQPTYRALIDTFTAQHGNLYAPDDVTHFVLHEPRLAAPRERALFLARVRIHVNFGASELFRGDGVTELMGGGVRTAGVIEVFSLDHAAKPVGEYEAAGTLVRVPCVPFEKPRPLVYKDPH